jgi:superfamily I DNA/RNA helicase
VCVVGDDRQAIYGFRGADSQSLARLKKDLKARELKLTTTYRCGKSIVTLAQTEVPDIEAGPKNGEGEVRHLDADKLVDVAMPGDFILSRLNAPLASYAMQLLREGKRAQIAGRDIGNGLKALVRKLGKGAYTVDAFLDAVDVWREKETKRLLTLKFEQRARLVEDQAETLYALSEGATSVAQVEQTIERLFTDDGGDNAYILLSSVHKAKGLEAETVFVLDWTFRRGKDQEENNIWYVAVTRAKHVLVFVEERR